MEQPLRTFASFRDEAMAEPLLMLLEEQAVAYEVEQTPPPLDQTFLGAGARTEIAINISPSDFAYVRSLMAKEAPGMLARLPEDYYLFDFSNTELREILSQPDAWNPIDLVLARQLLARRGQPVNEAELTEMQQKRQAQLQAPVPGNPRLLLMGLGLILLGGLPGIVLGLYFATATRTDLKGQRWPVFDPRTRRQGRWLAGLGTLILLGLLGGWFFLNLNA